MGEPMAVRNLMVEIYKVAEAQRVQELLKKMSSRRLRKLLLALRGIVKHPIEYAPWCYELKLDGKGVRLMDVVPTLGDLGLVDYWLDDQGDDFMGIEATEPGKAVYKKLEKQGYYDKQKK